MRRWGCKAASTDLIFAVSAIANNDALVRRFTPTLYQFVKFQCAQTARRTARKAERAFIMATSPPSRGSNGNMLTRRPNRRLLQRLDAADAVFRTTGDGSARRDANNAAHRTRHSNTW